MKTVCLFSDGSCLDNPGPGGWAYILEYGEHKKTASGGEAHTTNNQMELRAAIEGLKALKQPCRVKLYTDSSYVANAVNAWLEGWVKKNFKNVKNIPLWQEYLSASGPHEVEAIWVKGHAGHPQNELCDEMAREQAVKIKNSLKSDLIYSLDSASKVANLYGSYLARGDIKPLYELEKNIDKIDAKLLKEIANRYFNEKTSTTIILKKE